MLLNLNSDVVSIFVSRILINFNCAFCDSRRTMSSCTLLLSYGFARELSKSMGEYFGRILKELECCLTVQRKDEMNIVQDRGLRKYNTCSTL